MTTIHGDSGALFLPFDAIRASDEAERAATDPGGPRDASAPSAERTVDHASRGLAELMHRLRVERAAPERADGAPSLEAAAFTGGVPVDVLEVEAYDPDSLADWLRGLDGVSSEALEVLAEKFDSYDVFNREKGLVDDIARVVQRPPFEEASGAAQRALVRTFYANRGAHEAIAAHAEELLALYDSPGFGALGAVGADPQLREMVIWLASQSPEAVEDLRAIVDSDAFANASPEARRDLLQTMLFAPEKIAEVRASADDLLELFDNPEYRWAVANQPDAGWDILLPAVAAENPALAEELDANFFVPSVMGAGGETGAAQFALAYLYYNPTAQAVIDINTQVALGFGSFALASYRPYFESFAEERGLEIE